MGQRDELGLGDLSQTTAARRRTFAFAGTGYSYPDSGVTALGESIDTWFHVYLLPTTPQSVALQGLADSVPNTGGLTSRRSPVLVGGKMLVIDRVPSTGD